MSLAYKLAKVSDSELLIAARLTRIRNKGDPWFVNMILDPNSNLYIKVTNRTNRKGIYNRMPDIPIYTNISWNTAVIFSLLILKLHGMKSQNNVLILNQSTNSQIFFHVTTTSSCLLKLVDCIWNINLPRKFLIFSVRMNFSFFSALTFSLYWITWHTLTECVCVRAHVCMHVIPTDCEFFEGRTCI